MTLDDIARIPKEYLTAAQVATVAAAAGPVLPGPAAAAK